MALDGLGIAARNGACQGFGRSQLGDIGNSALDQGQHGVQTVLGRDVAFFP